MSFGFCFVSLFLGGWPWKGVGEPRHFLVGRRTSLIDDAYTHI